MAINYVKVVQSNWSKGMQSKVLSARNDTDLLSKGAGLLDNVVIMEQGGLRKRPCLTPTYAKLDGEFIGVVKLGSHIWAISHTNYSIVTFSQIDGNYKTDVMLSNNLSAFDSISFIQDGNVLLFSPSWKNVIYDESTNSFSAVDFIFDSFAYSYKANNSLFFTGYDPNKTITLHYYGQGDATALAQAQNPNAYISIGSKVIIYADLGLLGGMGFIELTKLVIVMNGLTMRVISFNGRALICVVLYGSSNVLPTEKVAQSYLSGWSNVYVLTCLASDLTILSFDFGAYDADQRSTYPKIVSNFQNRLITSLVRRNNNEYNFTRIPENNTKIWCSGLNSKYSFLPLTLDDDQPFSIAISGNVAPEVLNIFSGDYLYIMTNVGIYAFVNTTNSTFTPTNINLKKVSNHRCSTEKPIQHDGQLFYSHATGKSVLSLSGDATGDLMDIDRSMLCPTFFSRISHLCGTYYIGSNDENEVSDNSSYLLVLSDEVDQDTGHRTTRKCILAYQYMSSQLLDGWTRWTFSGDSYPVAMYTFEDRVFVKMSNGSRIYEFKFGIHKDIIDNLDPQIPKIKIQTHPYSLRDQVNGDLLFRRKKFGELCIYYLNTETLTVNGATHNVGALFDGQGINARDGILRVSAPNNYDVLNYVEITHEHDSDFSMIALQTTLEVGD